MNKKRVAKIITEIRNNLATLETFISTDYISEQQVGELRGLVDKKVNELLSDAGSDIRRVIVIDMFRKIRETCDLIDDVGRYIPLDEMPSNKFDAAVCVVTEYNVFDMHLAVERVMNSDLT